jgi:hypothetical protein
MKKLIIFKEIVTVFWDTPFVNFIHVKNRNKDV